MSFVKPAAASDAFVLIHISDFHVCRPVSARFSQFFNKRLLSYLSWQLRRRHEHREQILEALTHAVQAVEAGHIAEAGDLTQLALPAEFEQARRHLQALGPHRRVFVVPGNHDALVPTRPAEGLARCKDYMASDPGAPGADADFPAVRVCGRVVLIGLSTAHPTRPLSATGRIGAPQLDRCADILAEAARRELYRVVLIHHPPVPGMVSAHQRLKDSDAFARVVERCGAELVLHGHTHRRSQSYLPGLRARIPVLGVSAASAASRDPLRRATFRVFRINRAAAGWAATFQDYGYSEEGKCFRPGSQEPV